jgi:ABC-type sugar transport system ATPase subunit
MVLLGPSGCGKSTAPRMIAGLETVTEGEITIGDRVVNDIDAQDRDVAMVFQSYALYPHMSVRANIESPLRNRKYVPDGEDGPARKLTPAERDERVDQAADILDITDYMDRKPAALSGGQRQRVALARAIVCRPAAFLMDEPLSNLDAKLRTQTRAELVGLHRMARATTIYVTHDQVEAMTMATRIAIIESGRLQQVGTPEDVYDRPANLFVAQFIGSPPMSILDGVVQGTGSEQRVAVGDGRWPVPPGVTVGDGDAVKIGVRPEHIVPGGEGVTAEVKLVEWHGHEHLVSVGVGEATMGVRWRGTTPPQDSTVVLGVEPEHVHLFDADSGVRL